MEQYFGIIELGLVFCLALGLLGYELYSVRKAIAEDRRKALEDVTGVRQKTVPRT